MAIKFSQFTEKVDSANIDGLVGYFGNQNIRISPSDLVGTITINASNITTGTLADARLSSNVALKDVDNNFSVGQTIGGDTIINGNVGIGTPSPSAFSGTYLHIHDANISRLKLTNDTTGQTNLDGSEILVVDSDLSFTNRESGAVAFSTSATERMRIDSSGNVGIGENSLLSTVKLTLKNTNGIQRLGFNQTNDSNINIRSVAGKNSSITFTEETVADRWTFGVLAGDGSLQFRSNSSHLGNGTERMRIDSSGYLRLAGAGIQFNGDTAAANALDDYEEGTWTPTYIGSGGGAVTSYAVQSGTYTKIGNVVTLKISIRAAKGTISGDISIGGIPYAGGGYLNMTTRRRFATDFQLGGIVGASAIALYKIKSDELSPLLLTDADFSGGGTNSFNDINTTITYITS